MRAGPWGVVVATVSWSLWELRAILIPAQYLNDSSVHEQMVRFAAARIRAGHDPLTSWFPYLGLGSPQFMHYQSAPAILTGLIGLVVRPETAFRWSLYLLWCLWPIAVYASARIFGLRRWAAAMAAAVAPLLHSVPGIGYEQHAYIWAGYGVWTQLWGSWGLPFAWALTWRAVADRRFLAPAAALVSLTTAFHYETGYLAFLGVLIMPFLVWADLRARLLRSGALLASSVLASAWVVVPLLLFSRWAAVNQALAGTPLENGYGARETLGWLFTGRLLDDGHLPVVSLLAAVGLAAVVLCWQRPGPGRALVALLCAALVLSFGRTTFGGLVHVIPGSTDLFFRRFLMGAQLAAIYLAGIGAAEIGRQGRRLAGACAAFLAQRRLGWLSWVPVAVLVVAALGYLFPAWRYYDSYDAHNSAEIHTQWLLQQAERPEVAALAAYLRQHGDGRAYAGSHTNGGRYFTVGYVPMYAYLESLNIDETGYALRTASLMTQPEYWFDPANSGDYALFGDRYLVLPAIGKFSPRPGMVLVLHNSRFRVYQRAGISYFRVVDTVGSIAANRADVGSRTSAYLSSPLPTLALYYTVAYDGGRAAAPTFPPPVSPAGPPGFVLTEHASLTDGKASAVVQLRRRGVVVLSASFDPGWSVTVDGRPAATEMIAPALVGVTVPPGMHRIAFQYRGFGGYLELLTLAAVSLLATTLITRRRPLAGLLVMPGAAQPRRAARRSGGRQGDGHGGKTPEEPVASFPASAASGTPASQPLLLRRKPRSFIQVPELTCPSKARPND